MQVKVDVSPTILKWVSAHIARDVLSSQIQGYIDSWINGEKQPTFNQIEKVSKATGIPLGYFFCKFPQMKTPLSSITEQLIVLS